jgi:hypothetical protein
LQILTGWRIPVNRLVSVNVVQPVFRLRKIGGLAIIPLFSAALIFGSWLFFPGSSLALHVDSVEERDQNENFNILSPTSNHSFGTFSQFGRAVDGAAGD